MRKVRVNFSLDNSHSLDDFPIDLYSGLTINDVNDLVFANIVEEDIPFDLEFEDSDLNVNTDPNNPRHPYCYLRISSEGCYDEIILLEVPRVDCEMCVDIVENLPIFPTPTISPTPTSTPTPTISPTPTSSSTPTPSSTPVPTNEPTPTPTPTNTNTPTPTPTNTPTPSPTSTPTPTPSSTQDLVVAAVRLGTPEINSENACGNSVKNINNRLYILEGSGIFTLNNGVLKINVLNIANMPSVDYDIYYGDETISNNSIDSTVGTVNGGSPSAFYLVSETSCTNLIVGQKVIATVNDSSNPSTVTFSLCPSIQPTPTATSEDETGLLKIIDCNLLDENGQAPPGTEYYLIDPTETCLSGQLALTVNTPTTGDIIYYRVGDQTCSGSVMCAQVQSGTFTGTVTATRNGENIFTSCNGCYIP
jgi:hypothetical protein